MTPNLAIFYHCWWRRDAARDILADQIKTLKDCGLLNAAAEMHIGFQGTETGLEEVQTQRAPTKAIVHALSERLGEIPTLQLLYEWLPHHPGWKVCYFHGKGASHADAPHRWRHCLERAVLWRWRECVLALDAVDSAGAHWMQNAQGQSFWGGNFWWATASYLSQLPAPGQFNPTAGRWAAELWVSNLTQTPQVLDLMADHHLGECL